jgi:DNA (cytosine-5)-methyltransferase 1
MEIVSLFAGCGGLCHGFERSGFTIAYANENNKDVWATYEGFHPGTHLDRRDIRDVGGVPSCTGIIGGPPCQSWSEAGKQRGAGDDRGRLFWDYIRLLGLARPQFFVIENVAGILHKKHSQTLQGFLGAIEELGYTISHRLLNAADYGVPQDRERVFFVGYRNDTGLVLDFNKVAKTRRVTLKDAIGDLQGNAIGSRGSCTTWGHEYWVGGYSPMYMSRNRVRTWSEQSFTIQASARQTPQHPQSGKMIKVDRDRFAFNSKSAIPHRRLSVRECLRIQTFPDTFVLRTDRIDAAYRMVGNAVPPLLAEAIARVIKNDLN